jgi:hypothetical protein
MLLLAILGVVLADLALWAMAAEPDSYALTSPVVQHHQLSLFITGPSPNVHVSVYARSIVTSATVELIRIHAPVAALFIPMGMVIAVMVPGRSARASRATAMLTGSSPLALASDSARAPLAVRGDVFELHRRVHRRLCRRHRS